jgi:Cu-Zn family superoxide dismutase
MLKKIKYFSCIILSLYTIPALATISVPMYFTAEKGNGKSTGSVEISETKYGLLFTPHLHGLAPGIRGFHIHQNPSCAQNGMAAGQHFDPENNHKHLGPFNDEGHLGDLPALFVSTDKSASLSVLAPRIKHLADIKNHGLIVHNGGDNYADAPTKLGGGGSRMVCGIIQ